MFDDLQVSRNQRQATLHGLFYQTAKDSDMTDLIHSCVEHHCGPSTASVAGGKYQRFNNIQRKNNAIDSYIACHFPQQQTRQTRTLPGGKVT
jgi:hypothetical protein